MLDRIYKDSEIFDVLHRGGSYGDTSKSKECLILFYYMLKAIPVDKNNQLDKEMKKDLFHIRNLVWLKHHLLNKNYTYACDNIWDTWSDEHLQNEYMHYELLSLLEKHLGGKNNAV